ncbi:hypothetical protein K432DRAFT_346336 [Lepidopterella palustris CBS 459.81]|uniref:Kinetochore protein Sos7 coiled-coil domain-containing protein n=1 Tax=Lepidopterella palustris CBS 459.81 TaxID=1314670 RepID=A0A8E2JIP4_9PEZI|nr:hypothetical protein K432DRAFT_346336 [Lepidopterella palustris CBS 459.81]
MASSAAEASATLAELQKSHSLKIIELSDSIRPKDAQSAQKRSSGVSDASADSVENATPAGLEADLIHYKELFSKLRFSYVEQVTKEKFLRAITDNPPLFVEPSETAELEAQLVEAKAALKAQKLEVAELLARLDERGRQLSQRYESIHLRTTSLHSLPTVIASLESTISTLQHSQTPHPTNPALSLPLPETLSLLHSRKAELAALDAQIAALQTAIPQKTRELERLQAELRPLETQKKASVAQAKEARRRREEGGGVGDELEERGRWLRAAEKGLGGMLGVEG